MQTRGGRGPGALSRDRAEAGAPTRSTSGMRPVVCLIGVILLLQGSGAGIACHQVFPFPGAPAGSSQADQGRDLGGGDGPRGDGPHRPTPEASIPDRSFGDGPKDGPRDLARDSGADHSSLPDLTPPDSIVDVPLEAGGPCVPGCGPECSCPEGMTCNVSGECKAQTGNCASPDNWICAHASALQCRATCGNNQLICNAAGCKCYLDIIGQQGCSNHTFGMPLQGCLACDVALDQEECCTSHL